MWSEYLELRWYCIWGEVADNDRKNALVQVLGLPF